MKLSLLNETQNPLFDRVYTKIMSGDSEVKKGIEAGKFTIQHVLKAIVQNKCLPGVDRDLGATSLEQTVGGAIRDVVPPKKVNAARKLFGLAPIKSKPENRKPDRQNHRSSLAHQGR